MADMSAFWRQGGILTPELWREVPLVEGAVGEQFKLANFASSVPLVEGPLVEGPLVEGLPWEDMPLTTWCQLSAREMAQRTADWISAAGERRQPAPS